MQAIFMFRDGKRNKYVLLDDLGCMMTFDNNDGIRELLSTLCFRTFHGGQKVNEPPQVCLRQFKRSSPTSQIKIRSLKSAAFSLSLEAQIVRYL